MQRGSRLLILGFACIGLVQAQGDWQFAHPNADMRMSVNVQAVLKAPAVAEILKGKEQPPQVQMILGLLSSVNRISISARQNGKEQDVLVLVTGNFDASSMQALFPSKGNSQVKQVGPHAVLIGEGASFAQAVLRMAEDPVAGLKTREDELEQSDLWIAGSSAVMTSQSTAPMPPAFKPMRAFSFGMNLTETPEMNVILSATDSGSAAQMLTELRKMIGPMGNAVESKQDGSKIRLHFVMPPEMMRFAQTQAASGALGDQLQPLMGMFGMHNSPAPTPAPAPPPKNGGKIMIYGLDDGPREVGAK